MKFAEFKREVALAAEGCLSEQAANVDRALRRKEYTQCAQILREFAAACLEAQSTGDLPVRLLALPEDLPPVA